MQKLIFFCQNPYAFGILEPIMQVAKEKQYDYIWFLGPKIQNFPFKDEPHTRDLNSLKTYKSDAIFVPGNEVPHYLRGVKTQVFHGLAGEKKGHFRIRHYFDLYLTQGPYFTNKFNELKAKHKNFEVIETGWPKLDIYGKQKEIYHITKQELLAKHSAKKIILYAPTFSPSLTSAPFLLEEIRTLAKNTDYFIICKFHDLMSVEFIEMYKLLAQEVDNIVYETERNIIKFLLMADLMISDTSSVVYEFLLLDKPVITYKSSSKSILWDDSDEYEKLEEKVTTNFENDDFRSQRQEIIANYHPYNDGNSALRMVKAVEGYIEKNGVPEMRKLSFLRKFKINKLFG